MITDTLIKNLNIDYNPLSNESCSISPLTVPSEYSTSAIATGHHFNGDVNIAGDLTVNGNIKTPKGEFARLEIEENDIILITTDFNLNQNDCARLMDMWQEAFPNHKVIVRPKYISIDLIKDKSNRENEVSW